VSDDEPVRALNYSAHALEDLRALESSWQRLGWSRSVSTLSSVIGLLERSVKFILPNGCALIAPGDLREAHAELARLPFPCTAFEVPWASDRFAEHRLGGVPQAEANQRIALCWELGAIPEVTPGMDRLLDHFPGGGTAIVSIYRGPATGGWTIGLGGLFCPYEGRLLGAGEQGDWAPMSIAAREATIGAGLSDDRAKMLRTEPFRLFPEYFAASVEQVYGTEDAAFASIITDTQDESSVQLQVCALLACANVATEEIEPSEKLNKKRRAKGNQPFFSYRVFTLATDRAAHPDRAAQGGTQASPRMHLRRGHLRRLNNGRLIWVRPAVVSANSPRGVIDKDYRVDPGDNG